MNKERLKLVLIFIIGLLSAFLLMYLFTTWTADNSHEKTVSPDVTAYEQPPVPASVEQLTRAEIVIRYVKEHHRIPHYYLTKKEARAKGWIAGKKNLCDVLPGRAIGGDVFKNRERKLPLAAVYYEADVNYRCGHRGTDRIIFTDAGKVWLTTDHYKTFTPQ